MKSITLPSGKVLRVTQAQFAGEIVDAAGNPVDTGNTLITLTPDEDTTLPTEAIAAAVEPTEGA